MLPTFHNGDLVIFNRYDVNKSMLKSGDVIIFNHPSKNIRLIKRIKTIKEFSIEVSGDNKTISSDSNLFGSIQKGEILGIVTSKISNESINNVKRLFNS
tara:strand:+ start:131 stop:427 length:297 start_codon:yes stop_codon:yes gene_type:complete